MSTLEGWYSDPYDRHGERWFSAGTPTSLVRDAGVESDDPPPPGPFRHDPQPVDSGTGDHGAERRRADEAEAEPLDLGPLTSALLDDPYGVGPLTGGPPPSDRDVERTRTEPT